MSALPDPGTPADWLRHARSDLALSRAAVEGVLYENLCFHAQQAAEKGVKAVLVAGGITFPRTHNLSVLLDLVPKSIIVPPAVELATDLTEYAVATRYPGVEEPVTAEEYADAIGAAEAVVKWATDLVGTNPRSPAS